MQQRYMDAELGRFLTPDPVGPEEDFINHFNRYNYAMNNPVRYTDPDGRNGVTFVGGLVTESWNALNGRGFDGDLVMGALKDGYDGEGDGFAASAYEDATSFIPVAKPLQAVSKMQTIARLGRAGEVAAGIVKNTMRIPSASRTARYRIPDGLTKTTLTEVKNYSGTLRLTNQLKDFLSYAKDTKKSFELVIGRKTELSKPLQELVDSGQIILRRLK